MQTVPRRNNASISLWIVKQSQDLKITEINLKAENTSSYYTVAAAKPT